jgi:hypothetical protein
VTGRRTRRDVPEPEPEPARPEPVECAPPAAMLALQRTSGNQAVSRYLARRRGLIGTAELASRWNSARTERRRDPEVCFRVPSATTITALLAGGTVPEATLKNSIQLALERMAKENALKTTDPIPAVMLRLFPSARTFDETEFANVVDVTDRNKVYEKAADAESKLNATDQGRVLAAMTKAEALIDQAIKDAANLTRVFGGKANEAKQVYADAKTAMGNLRPKVGTNLETDYNLDAMQTGMGGFALFTKQTVHLNAEVIGRLDDTDLVITLIHECAHLAAASVKDKGYYESANWDGLDEDIKVANAAHYEEIPRRYVGKSIYKADQVFTPGASAGGGALTYEDEVRRMVEEYGRKCHASAQELHVRLRGMHLSLQKGDRQRFDDREARILEVSKNLKLTIHEQNAPRTITELDLSLSEGVTHAAWKLKAVIKAQTIPNAASGKSMKDAATELIKDALKAYGTVTGSEADDRTLFKWLFTNNGKLGI